MQIRNVEKNKKSLYDIVTFCDNRCSTAELWYNITRMWPLQYNNKVACHIVTDSHIRCHNLLPFHAQAGVTNRPFLRQPRLPQTHTDTYTCTRAQQTYHHLCTMY